MDLSFKDTTLSRSNGCSVFVQHLNPNLFDLKSNALLMLYEADSDGWLH